MFRLYLLGLLLLLWFATPAVGQDYLWCYDADEIVFDLNPQSHVLTIEHKAAMYNCCPEPVSHDVVVTEGLISITESAGELQLCDCICCFDLKVEVGEIPVGFWTVKFQWRQEETGHWVEQQVEIVVPEAGDASDPQVLFQEISDCLISSTVPDPPETVSIWGSLKSWYRTAGGM